MRAASSVRRAADCRLVGNCHFDAELLRLVVGARHQRHARDAGRKAEIVLDARRGAGLATEGPAIEHDRRQAFRCRIDRRRQPGRPGADDRDVVELVASIGRTRPMQRASSFSPGLRRILPFGQSTIGR